MSTAWIDPAPRLEGEHVRLEPLTLEHVDGLTSVGLDADIWRWTLSQAGTGESMRAYVEQALALRECGAAVPFATVERAGGRVVGSTRYGNLAPEHRRLEIGWTWLARDWQRTALNTEAKYLMLRHAFETLECVRVEFKTDALNKRSRVALRRIGAQEEGVLRSHMITAGGRVRDTVYYSILADEWPLVRHELEAKLAGSGEGRP